MKYPDKVLLVLGLILIIGNFYVIDQYALREVRWARIVSCALLFSFFVIISKLKRNLLTVTFALFLISALLSLQNEVLLIRKLNLGVVITAYLLLILHVLPMVKNLKTDLFQKMTFILIVGVNLYMLYSLADMKGGKIQDYTQLVLLFLRGISIIGVGIMAFSYCNRYSNTGSIYFLLAVLGLVLSDIFAFVSFYLEIWNFVFVDRFFYIIGIACLARYATLYRKEDLQATGELL